MTEKKKRTVVISLLCGVLLLMAVGYAAFQSVLNIEGTATISSNWNVLITNVQEKNKIGTASTVEGYPTWTNLTANIQTNLVSPGDSIEYDVTIENQGNLNAELEKININENDNPAIKFTTTELEIGDIIESGQSKILTVKVEYDSNITTQPENLEANFNIELNYVEEGKSVIIPDIEFIDFETVETSKSITVKVKDEGIEGITKYEYKIDEKPWEEEIDNTHTFKDLTKDTEHNIQVQVTQNGNVVQSEIKPIKTKDIGIPTFSEIETSNRKDITITYPEGCDTDYKCTYSKNGAGDVVVKTKTEKVQFTERGNLVAKVDDGYNSTVSSSYTVFFGPLGYEGNNLILLYDGINNNSLTSHSNSIKTWQDLSGHGNNGTINSGSWSSNSLISNESTSPVYIANKLSTLFNSSNTIEFRALLTDSSSRDIFIGNFNSSSGTSINYEKYNNASRLWFYGGSVDYHSSNLKFPTNKAFTITYVYDKINNKIMEYLDGKYIDYTSVPSISNHSWNSVYIGGDGRTGSTVLGGNIYSVRIYNAILSDTIIKSNYDNDVKRY